MAFQNFITGIRNYLICLTKHKHLTGTQNSVYKLEIAKLKRLILDKKMVQSLTRQVCPSNSQVSIPSDSDSFKIGLLDNNDQEKQVLEKDEHF